MRRVDPECYQLGEYTLALLIGTPRWMVSYLTVMDEMEAHFSKMLRL